MELWIIKSGAENFYMFSAPRTEIKQSNQYCLKIIIYHKKTINPNPPPTGIGFGLICYGGDEEDRTLDLTDANRTLSQLSYAPELFTEVSSEQKIL